MSLGFIGGLAAAAQGYNQASKDWEVREQAQAAEQRRTEEHAYSQQKRQIEMDELERAKTIRAETEAAAKPLEVQAAQEQLGEDVAGPPATLYKAGDQTFTDQAKANAYATDAGEAAKRAAVVKLKYGDVDGSLSLGQKMMQSRDLGWKLADTEQARQVEQINNEIYKRLYANGKDIFANGANFMTELDPEKNIYKAERLANGTVTINQYAPSGALLGTKKTYTDDAAGQREALSGFLHAPTSKEKLAQYDEVIKNQNASQKAQFDALKSQSEVLVNRAKVSDHQARVSGTGYYAKVPKETKKPADAISEGFKNFRPDDKPAGRAEGENLARQAKALNPGATDQELIYAAQAAVVDGLDSPNIKQRLDFNTGQVTAVFTDPRTGKPIKLHQAPPKPEMVPALKADVQAYLAEQDKLGVSLGSKTKWSEALIRAASNPQDKAAMAQVVQNEVARAFPIYSANAMRNLQAINQQLRAAGKPEGRLPTPEQLMDKLTKTMSSPQDMAAINNRLNLIRTYGLK